MQASRGVKLSAFILWELLLVLGGNLAANAQYCCVVSIGNPYGYTGYTCDPVDQIPCWVQQCSWGGSCEVCAHDFSGCCFN